MVKFKDFKIKEFFDIHPTKSYGLTNDKLFSTFGKTPVVVNSSMNNGIGGYVDLPATEKGNIITFSDTTTDNAIFYQPDDFIGYSHVQGVYPLENNLWSSKSLLYFLACFKKAAKGRFNYATKFNRNIALEMTVYLPITDSGALDFNFMEKRISELEEERISELTAYLKVSGLEDCHLTNEEQKTIEKYRSNKIVYKKFKLNDLFSCQTGDVDLQQKDIDNEGEYFINSGLQNNGIKGKTTKKARVFNENTITIDFWGNAFYRDFKYKMATHNHVFSLSGEIIKNKKIGLYLTAQMSYFKKIFSYDNMGTWNKFKEMHIELPIINQDIDFDFIETFINAQQKLAIKSVIDWRDKEINISKKIINN